VGNRTSFFVFGKLLRAIKNGKNTVVNQRERVMDMKVRNSRVESSLDRFKESVALVRKHARYVIELNARGHVRKVRRNIHPKLNVIAITAPSEGHGSPHVIVAEIGLKKHRPYARTMELKQRERYRTLHLYELGNVLPTLEKILDLRREIALLGRKTNSFKWVRQGDMCSWSRFETGIRIRVSKSDTNLYHVFCGADLQYRRAAFGIDCYKGLISWWIDHYARSTYSTKEMRRRPGIRKAVGLYRCQVGPFVARYVVSSAHQASLISCAIGEDVEWGVPEFLPLKLVCARFVKQRPIRGGKKWQHDVETFEIVSGDAIKTMCHYKKNTVSLHRSNIPEEDLKAYLKLRYQEKECPTLPNWI
jgi:hypothetical protein